jgi:hypothetical protein
MQTPPGHVVPSETAICVGQASELPLHIDAIKQAVAGAHTVPAPADTSAGQAVEIPSQVSLTSQPPLAARHTNSIGSS